MLVFPLPSCFVCCGDVALNVVRDAITIDGPCCSRRCFERSLAFSSMLHCRRSTGGGTYEINVCASIAAFHLMFSVHPGSLGIASLCIDIDV